VTRSAACATAILAIAALARPALASDADPGDDVPPGRLTFRVFAAADGLRNLAITSIAQDARGFLWLGTDEGVYRFDGEQFTHFSVAAGLMSSDGFAVGVGPDGEVCAGSSSGLACWDRIHRTFRLDVPQEQLHIGIQGIDKEDRVRLPEILTQPFRDVPEVEAFLQAPKPD